MHLFGGSAVEGMCVTSQCMDAIATLFELGWHVDEARDSSKMGECGRGCWVRRGHAVRVECVLPQRTLEFHSGGSTVRGDFKTPPGRVCAPPISPPPTQLCAIKTRHFTTFHFLTHPSLSLQLQPLNTTSTTCQRASTTSNAPKLPHFSPHHPTGRRNGLCGDLSSVLLRVCIED
jgi:hypothetical protein